jgi:phosphoribosylformylglycinamidine synthase
MYNKRQKKEMEISASPSGAAEMSARVLVIGGYGVNCEKECAYAARKAGAEVADIVFFSDLAAGRRRIADYNFVIFPGGFLDGDDLGAAQAAAQRWKYSAPAHGAPFTEQLLALVDRGGLILGICNGFQLLVKLGLLPALDNKYLERQVSLTHNASGRFEDRWCRLLVNRESPCAFTRGLDFLYMPVRHGEGRLVPADDALLYRLHAENLGVLYYADERGLPTQDYPDNPNGSPLGLAGLCDPTGRIFGLMPHPEAYNHPANHPGWTRGESAPSGLTIFACAVRLLCGG